MKVLAVVPTPFVVSRGSSLRAVGQLVQIQLAAQVLDIVTYPLGSTPKELGISRIYRAPFSFGRRLVAVGPGLLRVVYDIQMLVQVLWLLVKNSYDIVYAYNYEGVVISKIAQALVFWKKIVMIADIQGSFTEEMQVYYPSRYRYISNVLVRAERLLYTSAGAYIVSSPELEVIIKSLNPNKRVLLSGDEGLLMRTTVQLPAQSDQVKKIVYTGGFTHEKGVEILLSAFADTFFKSSGIRLVLAGSPVDRITDFVTSHPHRDLIEIIDTPDDETLAEVLAGAYMVCDPKYGSTMQSSGKLLRYLSGKAPVVTFNTPTNRYYLGDGYEYVEHSSSDRAAEYATMMKSLLMDPNKYEYLQGVLTARRCEIEKEFDPSRLGKFLEQYSL